MPVPELPEFRTLRSDLHRPSDPELERFAVELEKRGIDPALVRGEYPPPQLRTSRPFAEAVYAAWQVARDPGATPIQTFYLWCRRLGLPWV
jgi:hypothetical protein